jgi:lipid-A-disaccharide synthase-like uncharacterized protein
MTALAGLGWVGNTAFFSRFLVQWLVSERAGRSLTPRGFWWLSLLGSLALGVYALAGEHYILLLGYALNGLIYARNLGLRPDRGERREHDVRWLAALAALTLLAGALLSFHSDREPNLAWLACAGLGQAIWSTRFVVQWVASERSGESHFPRSFWWLSLVGNALLLAFTIHVGDLVLIASYVPGPIVQVRNLVLSAGPRGARASSIGSDAHAAQLEGVSADVVAQEHVS